MKEGCSVDNRARILLLKSENFSYSVPNRPNINFFVRKTVFCSQRWIGRVKCIFDKGAESFLLKLEKIHIFS